MVIRYRGTSPKLGSCQGECPYPCDYFFGGGEVGIVDDGVVAFFFSSLRLRLKFSSLRSSFSSSSFIIFLHSAALMSCKKCGGIDWTLGRLHFLNSTCISPDSRALSASWRSFYARCAIIHHHHHHLHHLRGHNHMGMGTPLGNCQAWGRCPSIVSPSHSYLYRFI